MAARTWLPPNLFPLVIQSIPRKGFAMRNPLKCRSLLFPLFVLAVAAIVIGAAAVQAGEDEDKDVIIITSTDRGWLGITMQDLDDDMVKALDLMDSDGILVNSVLDDSPAEKAGIEDGDVIIEFAGREIEDSGDLAKAVGKTDPGDEVQIVVLRDGEQKTLTAEIGERELRMGQLHVKPGEEDPEAFFYSTPGGKKHHFAWKEYSGDRGYMGVKLQGLNEQLGEYFGVEDGEGVLISEVIEDSPAAEAGLQAGDVIVKIDDEDIAEADDIHEYLGDKEKGDEVQVSVLRNKRHRNIKVTLGEAPDDLAWFGSEDYEIFLPHMEGMNRLRGMHLRAPHAERYMFHSEDEMDELREDLQELKEELKELKRELKNG